MSKDTEFAEGIFLKRFDFENGGFIIKMGIQKDEFLKNLFNNKGYANFDIKFRKSDNEPYCVVNSFHKTTAKTTHRREENSDDIEYIPF